MIQLFFCVTWPQVITILSSFVWYGRICGQRGWRTTESPEWLLETALRATHVHVGVRSTHVKHTTWAAFNWCFTTFSFSAYIGSLIQKKYLSYDLCFSLTYRGLHVTDVLAACTHMCPGTHWENFGVKRDVHIWYQCLRLVNSSLNQIESKHDS